MSYQSRASRSLTGAIAGAIVLGLGNLAGAAEFAAPIDLSVTRTGVETYRVNLDHTIGATTRLTDARVGGETLRIESARNGERIVLDVIGADRGADGDLIRISIADLPGGVKAASATMIAGDGEPIGTIDVFGDKLFASWFVGDARRRGGVTIGFSAAGAPLLPQPVMSEPLDGLTADELTRWLDGRVDYDTQITEEMGLGPIFNKENCSNCHNQPLGATGVQTVKRFGFIGKGGFDPLTEFGGPLLQAGGLSLECLEQVHGTSNVETLRVTNGMLGYGLVEAITDADLIANENFGSVTGRAHIVEALEDPGVPRVGRFGWKAQLPTILSFSADASMMEMGLTNRLIPFENDPNGILPPTLEECDTVPDPEDFADEFGREFIDRVTDFQRFLAAPPQTPRSGMSGELIFNAIGCSECHIRDFATPSDPGIEGAIAGKAIQPYSDFLLHDMGLAGDFIPDGMATGQELRTPPLWGLRRRPALWHDGRFNDQDFNERVRDAIEEHGAFLSEGAASKVAWDGLSSSDQDAVFAFLNSLGRAEFDVDLDDQVMMVDWFDFMDCLGSVGVTADDACAIHDVDQDGDVDTDDFSVFLITYDGDFVDCNGNGTLDIEEITLGLVDDLDGNGVPDSCENCPADLDGSGTVDFNDLVTVLASWGPCDGACPADFDGSLSVDFNDLVTLLASWGPCS